MVKRSLGCVWDLFEQEVIAALKKSSLAPSSVYIGSIEGKSFKPQYLTAFGNVYYRLELEPNYQESFSDFLARSCDETLKFIEELVPLWKKIVNL